LIHAGNEAGEQVEKVLTNFFSIKFICFTYKAQPIWSQYLIVLDRRLEPHMLIVLSICYTFQLCAPQLLIAVR